MSHTWSWHRRGRCDYVFVPQPVDKLDEHELHLQHVAQALGYCGADDMPRRYVREKLRSLRGLNGDQVTEQLCEMLDPKNVGLNWHTNDQDFGEYLDDEDSPCIY